MSRLSLAASLIALVLSSACSKDEPAPNPGPGTSDGAVIADAGDPGVDASNPSPLDAMASDAGFAPDAQAGDASEPRDAFPGFADARGPADAIVPSPDATTAMGRDADMPGNADAAPGGTDAAPAGADATATGNADAAVQGGPDAAPQASEAGAPGTDAGNLCTRGSDCIPGAELCGRLVVENNAVVTRCGPPNTMGPARTIGGQCASDAECASGLCLDGLVNECSQVCTDAATDCPPGFACAGYTYNPGNVQVPLCNRSCTDDDDCPTPNTACSTQSYRDPQNVYQLATVCQAVSGMVPLGGTCAGGADCRSGICFTNTRLGVGCAACMGNERCENGTDCVLQACTALCDDPSDCASGGGLTRCASGINLTLPDGTTRPISACARP